MKISFIVTSVKIVPELTCLITEILKQSRSEPEIDFQLVTVTQFSNVLMKDFENQLKEDYTSIIHINTDGRFGYFSTFNLALEQKEIIDSDLFVFMNDDIIIPSNFLNVIKQSTLDRGILYAPLVRKINAAIQLSVFRKNYSKLTMFFRFYDEGLYSKVGRLLRTLDTKTENINRNRYTVFGCCFIMNQTAVTQMGKFDDRIFLYYEEVFLFAMVRKFNWECKVLTNLSINHRGGATTTRRFTPIRSHMDKQSAIYVAKEYLGFNRTQLLILRMYKLLEIFSRQLISLISKGLD